MKIRIWFIFVLMIIPSITSARDIRFIVFADPQVAWLSPAISSIESAGIRGGLNAGFEMDNFFSTSYAFSTGLSINSIGGKLKFSKPFPVQFSDFSDSIAPGNIIIYKLQYLDLPLGLKFTTREIGYSTIYVKLGFGTHFNIRSRADISARGIENENLKDEIALFNLSYHFGAGVQYSLGGQTSVVAGFEYRHRFFDIASSPHYKALLNSLSLRAGVLF